MSKSGDNDGVFMAVHRAYGLRAQLASMSATDRVAVVRELGAPDHVIALYEADAARAAEADAPLAYKNDAMRARKVGAIHVRVTDGTPEEEIAKIARCALEGVEVEIAAGTTDEEVEEFVGNIVRAAQKEELAEAERATSRATSRAKDADYLGAVETITAGRTVGPPPSAQKIEAMKHRVAILESMAGMLEAEISRAEHGHAPMTIMGAETWTLLPYQLGGKWAVEYADAMRHLKKAIEILGDGDHEEGLAPALFWALRLERDDDTRALGDEVLLAEKDRGTSNKQMAKETGRPVSSIGTALSRARKRRK